jgi:hypothetical protein
MCPDIGRIKGGRAAQQAGEATASEHAPVAALAGDATVAAFQYQSPGWYN